MWSSLLIEIGENQQSGKKEEKISFSSVTSAHHGIDKDIYSEKLLNYV